MWLVQLWFKTDSQLVLFNENLDKLTVVCTFVDIAVLISGSIDE